MPLYMLNGKISTRTINFETQHSRMKYSCCSESKCTGAVKFSKRKKKKFKAMRDYVKDDTISKSEFKETPKMAYWCSEGQNLFSKGSPYSQWEQISRAGGGVMKETPVLL